MRRATTTEIPPQHADAWLAGRYAPPGARRSPLRLRFWLTFFTVVTLVWTFEITAAIWLLTKIADRMPR